MTISDQFKTLLTEPIKAAFDDASSQMIIFVVDALDECEDKDTTEMMLRLLLQHAPGLPVKFFVTSRPERRIRETLSIKYPAILHLHEVDKDGVNADIELYLRTKLTAIADARPTLCSRGEWPPKAQIQILTHRANGLFIYASTALKFIAAVILKGGSNESYATTPSRSDP